MVSENRLRKYKVVLNETDSFQSIIRCQAKGHDNSK